MRTLADIGHAPISGRWAQLLGTIEEASSRNRHRPDLPSLLDQVLQKISDMFEIVWAAAWLFDQDEDAWVIAASVGLTPESAGIRLSSGTALPCRVGEQGVPLLVNDLGAEEFQRTSEEHSRMRSALYAPMRIGPRTVGVIALYSDRRGAFTTRDRELLTAVGEHLGVAVAFSLMEDRTTQIAILEERDRHGRDLHDGVHQVLSSLRIYALEARKSLLDGDPEEARILLEELTRTIDDGSQELQESIQNLRSRNDVYRDVYEMVPRMRSRLDAVGVVTALSMESLTLSPTVSDSLAWICRESTNNVLKHSNARNVTLALRSEGDAVVLSVEDDGDGMPAAVGDGAGVRIGLDVMRERAASMSGRLTIEPGGGGGTRVECRIPISQSR